MKNKRAIVMMAVAVLFGIGAVLLAWKWLQSQTSGKYQRVVVASVDVSRGQKLTPDMLTAVTLPAREVPHDAITDSSKLSERVLKLNVVKGDILSESKLAPAGTMGGLSALISEGKRAITVRVNDVIGVAGFALPGNYVDIIVHTERDPGEDQAHRGMQHVSKIVLERILVLAVAQEVSRDETKPKVVNAVTLEVTPEQAENLDLARGVGTLSLALRNQVDSSASVTLGATKSTLLDELAKISARQVTKAEPAVVVRRKPSGMPALPPVSRHCINVLNGLQRSQECF